MPQLTHGSTAGRTMEEFAREAKFGLSTMYTLIPEAFPVHTKIGRHTVITEEPADWLQRVRHLPGPITKRRSKSAAE